MHSTSPVVTRLRSVVPTISAGILTANLGSLDAEVSVLEGAGVDILHFDVMDGCFCPMMTVGPPVVAAVSTKLLKDVHLMVERPLEKLGAFAAAGADMLTVHLEACRHPHRVLQAIGTMTNANDPDRGIARGIALNPGTPVQAVEPLLGELDMVFVLAVNPGWGGQLFAPSTPSRIAGLLEMIRRSKRDIIVGVDGGIKRGNIDEVARYAADIIVTGSAVFDGGDAASNARFMMEAVRQAQKP